MIEFLPELWDGALVTLQVTALAMVLGVAMSLIAGLARLSPTRVTRAAARVYIEVFRGTSTLVQLFWLFFVLPLFGVTLAPLTAGVIALGLNFGGYGGEVVRAGILAVPRGQSEAARALNLSRYQSMRLIILPQALLMMLPSFGNLAIDLLKGSALVSLISVADLTYEANIVRTSTGSSEVLFTAMIYYYLIAVALTWMFRGLERGVRGWLHIERPA
jgi:polar amino acid transport system permease protein